MVLMTDEPVIPEIRIDEAAGRGDSDSRMTSLDAIMSLKLQSTKMLIYEIWNQIKDILYNTRSMHSTIGCFFIIK